MTHVVTEACIGCKYTDCVDVCPVDCFREGPVNAILPEEDVPSHQLHVVALNAELARVAGWPAITKRKAPLPDADEWKDRTAKLVHLIR